MYSTYYIKSSRGTAWRGTGSRTGQALTLRPTGLVLLVFIGLMAAYGNGSSDSRIALYSILSHMTNRSRYFKTVGNTYRTSVKLQVSISSIVSYQTVASSIILIVFIWWKCLILNQSGDVHPNPGPSSISSVSDSDISSCSFEYLSGMFSVFHVNIQSLKPKLDVLEQEVQPYDVVILTETWLNNTVQNSSLVMQNFAEPHRLDRPDRIGGGVAVYVHESLTSKRRHDLEIAHLEAIWVEVKIKSRTILVGGFYRPPNSNREYMERIHESIDRAKNTSINNIIVTGDFNLNQLNNTDRVKIDDISMQFGLHQLINDCTHFTEHSSSIIDLMFVDKKDSVLYSGVSDPFIPNLIRYHCPIFAIFKFAKPKSATYKRTIWKYEDGDYDKLRTLLSETDWTCLSDDITINDKCDYLTSKIKNAASESIPNKTALIRPSDQTWVNGHIRKLIRKRKRLYRRAKRTNNDTCWANFRAQRNKVISEIKKAKTKYNDDLSDKLKNCNTDPKLFWKVSKQLLNLNKSQRSLPDLQHNGQVYETDPDKASLLNDFFISQSTIDDSGSNLPPPPPQPINTSLSTINITTTDISDVLAALNSSKASGPDLIHPRVLKESKDYIKTPLATLFNNSLNTSIFPSQWKQANVTPVYKKEDPASPGNYRPISLLSCIGKVMERCVHKYIFNYITANKLLSPFQSGFVTGDSTTNQLLSIYHTFCEAVDAGKEVRVVFFDISKAFDRVWHNGLIFKLRNLGINGSVLAWLENYLTDRMQRVVINGQTSEWKHITAGVPQGSILGPLLFLVYINDIANNIQSNIRLFADDTSLFIIVDDPVNSAQYLNRDLDRINIWAEEWLVKFNPIKTEQLLFSLKHNSPPHPPLLFSNSQITMVPTHKHLGLNISNSGDWHSHVDSMAKKSWQKINILKGLKFRVDRQALDKMYTSYIRPLLEYSSVVWDNCTLADKQKLESIQVEAARIVTGATKLCKIENLYAETGWETLQTRRDYQKLIMLYKMVNKLVPPFLSDIVPARVGDTTNYPLRNSENFQLPRTRTRIYKDSFLPSTLHAWNNLDIAVRNAPSLSAFKNTIRGTPTKIPDYYHVGTRLGQILHTRLRLECSSLNDHLFRKNIVASPLCNNCGCVETTYHFLLECPHYSNLRITHFSGLHQNINEHQLLFGIPAETYETNKSIFLQTHKYILESKRFSS